MGKTKKKQADRLKNLSMYPLKMEDALKAFMEVNPDEVEKQLEDEGIVRGNKAKRKTKKKN